MAQLNTSAADPFEQLWDLSVLQGAPTLATLATLSWSFTFEGAPVVVTFTGLFSTILGGKPQSGTITGLTVLVRGLPVTTILGMNAPLTDMYNAITANDANSLFGGWLSGADTVTGGSGANVLIGQAGSDQMSGLAGADGLRGGDGADVLDGGLDDDSLYGGFGQDTLTGGAGIDILFGGRDADNLDGGDGNDVLAGGVGVGAVVDSIITSTSYVGDAAADIINGGLGTDMALFYYQLEDAAFTVDISVAANVFTILRSGAAFGSITGVERLWIQGGNGADRFVGGALSDTLLGGAGNDVLIAGGGEDGLYGEAGDDTLTGGKIEDALYGGTGVDTAVFGATRASFTITTDLVTGMVMVQDIRSGSPEGADSLSGIEYLKFTDQTISVLALRVGTASADSLTGSALADILIGAAGDDVLDGADADDSLNGQLGNDTLYGGAGIDLIDGGDGADSLYGGLGNDTINGGIGNDIIIGGDGIDTLNGEAGDDQVTGDGFLSGSAGNDVLTDVANGVLSTLDGGLGNDILNGDGTTTATYVLTGGGVTVDLRLTGAQQTGSAGLDTLNNIRHLTGSAYDDILTGDANANTLYGGAGEDRLNGGSGDDTLLGVHGDDILDGGAGIDTASYNVAGPTGVQVDLAVRGAQDTGLTGGYDTLINIENLTGGNMTDTLAGDAGANVLRGLGGDDILYGRDGDDLLIGDVGSDKLYGGAGIDTASYAYGAAVTVTLGLTTSQNTGVGYDTLSEIENLTGSAFNDTLSGDGLANGLSGGTGNDTLNGNDGNDVLNGQAGDDVLNGGLGSDIAVFAGARSAYTVTDLGAGGLRLVSAAEGSDTATAIEVFRFADGDYTAASLLSGSTPTPPAAPVIGALAALVNAHPQVTGTAEAGVTVQLFLDGTLIGQTTASGAGAWTVSPDLSAAADGAHAFTARAVNANGSSALSAPRSTILDDTAPTAPTFSSAGGVVTGTAYLLSGLAEAGVVVQIFDGATALGSVTAAANGTWSQSLTLATGAHSLSARATDAVGNTGATAQLNVTVQTAPALTLAATETVISDTGLSATDRVTADGRVTLDITATQGAVVNITDKGVLIAQQTIGASGVWAYAATLAEGDHQLRATATLGADQQIRNFAGLTVDTTVSLTTTQTLAADNGISATDSLTNDGHVTLAGATDAAGRVDVYDQGVFVGSTVADGAGAWTLDLDLAEGVHKLQARATDAAGNTRTGATQTTITIDKTAPLGTPVTRTLGADTGSSATDNITTNGWTTLSGPAEIGAVVSISDGAVRLAQVTVGANGQWSYGVTLAEGVHNLRTEVMDKAGNITHSGPLAPVTVDKTAPSISGVTQTLLNDTGSSATDVYTNDGRVLVQGAAETGARIEIYSLGVLRGVTQAGSDGRFSTMVDLNVDGAHKLQVKAIDLAGNTSTNPTLSTITTDFTGPALANRTLTLAADTGAGATDLVTSNGQVSLSATAEIGAVVSLYDGAVRIGQSTVGSTGQWSFATTLAEGVHALRIEAADKAGNITDLGVQTVTVDKTAPSLVTLTSDTGAVSATPRVALSGGASENAQIEILRDGVVIGSATSTGGHWDYLTDATADGSYVYTARITDLAGNSRTSSPYAVTIQGLAAPQITGFSTDTGASATDGVTKDNTLVVRGTAELGATVSVYDNGTLAGTAVANSTGFWTFNYASTVLADGGHVFTAIATVAAQSSVLSAGLLAQIDTIAPTDTSLVVSANGVTLASSGYASAPLNLSGYAEAGSAVTLTSSTAGVIGVVQADAFGHWTMDYSPTIEGKLAFTARATDLAGNVSAVAMQTVIIDLTAPAPDLRSAVNSSTNTTFTGVSEAGSIVQVYEGNVLLGQATASSAGAWTLKIAKLSDLPHTLTLLAVDKASNEGASTGVTLLGGSGADVMTGTAAHDVLFGMAGNDRLNGWGGADILTGGAGADTFVFTSGQAAGDQVTDFTSGLDHLEFRGFNAGATAVLGAGGVLTVSDGVLTEIVQLTGVTSLLASDYHFV